jgi:HNH endonuclease
MIRKGVNLRDNTLSPLIRFTASFEEDKKSGCWVWQAGMTRPSGRDGLRYGKLRVRGKSMLAHRFSYEISAGAIPAGMCILHRCDNPPCVNPAHLFPGKDADNTRDMLSKDRESRGEDRYNAVLTQAQVEEFKSGYVPRSSTHGVRAYAKKFGVKYWTLFNVARGRTWKFVK